MTTRRDELMIEHGNEDTVSPILASIHSDNGRLPMAENARLISSAPELLAVLEDYCEELELAHGGHGQMPEMEAGFYDKAKKVIAKAKGEQ